MLTSRMITEKGLEHSLGEMVEVSEEKDYRIEMLEVIRGKEVLEVIEVAIKVNGMEEIQVIRETMVEEEMGGVEEEMVGETTLETSNIAETLEIRSRNR